MTGHARKGHIMREQKYVDHESPKCTSGYDIVQPKHDGQWCRVEIKSGVAEVHSRHGRLAATLDAPAGVSAVLVGEYMAGTTRASNSQLRGKIVVFDCLAVGGQDISESLPYADRLEEARKAVAGSNWGLIVESLPAADTEALWVGRVEPGELEGVILRRSGDGYHNAVLGRVKKRITRDYIVLGVAEGSGKHAGSVGSLVCGVLGSDGWPVEVCRVGTGLADADRNAIALEPNKYIGRVVEVLGHGEFKSGAVRHPVFSRWRPDKKAADCVLAQ